MHERISFNNLCFPGASLEEDIAHWRALGAHRVGIIAAKMNAEGCDAYVQRMCAEPFRIATIMHPFMAPHSLDQEEHIQPARDALSRTLQAAKTMGAKTVYMTTGGRGTLTFEQAAERFCTAVAPCAQQARDLGVQLLIEPAPFLYADLHLVHTLRDTVQLAEQAGLGVCTDIFTCWYEPDLRGTIERSSERCHLVQVSDCVLGDRSLPCRAVPGDGAIPLEQIIGWMLEAGYRGPFDLELIGPRIDKEGHFAAVERTGIWLTELLGRLGA